MDQCLTIFRFCLFQTMQKALRHTVIVDFSHYVQRKLLFRWFKSDVFQQHFGAYSRCERRYPYIKGCNSGVSQKILWEQVVTCSAHSKEHSKTHLAEYWAGRRGGCKVGKLPPGLIHVAAEKVVTASRTRLKTMAPFRGSWRAEADGSENSWKINMNYWRVNDPIWQPSTGQGHRNSPTEPPWEINGR